MSTTSGYNIYENNGTGLRLEDGGRCNQRSTWHYCAGELRQSTRKDENKLRKTCARIEALIEEYQVEKIVIGLPKHMNNDIGIRAEKSMEFAEMLKRRTGLEVQMWDERLTTMEAERTLIESNIRREDRKKYIDKIAAVFILQGYLDSVKSVRCFLYGKNKIYIG